MMHFDPSYIYMVPVIQLGYIFIKILQIDQL